MFKCVFSRIQRGGGGLATKAPPWNLHSQSQTQKWRSSPPCNSGRRFFTKWWRNVISLYMWHLQQTRIQTAGTSSTFSDSTESIYSAPMIRGFAPCLVICILICGLSTRKCSWQVYFRRHQGRLRASIPHRYMGTDNRRAPEERCEALTELFHQNDDRRALKGGVQQRFWPSTGASAAQLYWLLSD